MPAAFRYPSSAPFATHRITVSETPFHQVYVEEHGNPEGEPVIFIHGGPGGACDVEYARFFNPKRYRIILPDQRGCGKSIPNAAKDANAALQHNTTPHLIHDIATIAKHLGINGKFHLFGGSWGSTLSLAFAIAQPERVASLTLRGIFLCRKQDLDYFYQGNAAFPVHDYALAGTYIHFPHIWREFVEFIPENQRHDMVKAYSDIFHSNDDARKQQAALVWSKWEGATSYLTPDEDKLNRFTDPAFAAAFARIENHYFLHGAFLDDEKRENNFILEHLHRLKNIPTAIVHGRYDVVCPLTQAYALAEGLQAQGITPDFRITTAGHSQMEPENTAALTNIMDNLPPMPV